MSSPASVPQRRFRRGRFGLPPRALPLLLGVLVGCTPSVGASGGPAPVSRMEVDDEGALARIGLEVPGFAGYELRGEVLRLLLVDTTRAAAAEVAVRRLLAGWQPDAKVAGVEVVPARFDYVTLREARDRLAGGGLYAVVGVVAAGIDTGANTIVVEVSGEGARRPVERIVRRRGIPPEMVSIAVTGPVVF